MNGKGYGMPSSHAQFLAYFALTLALFLLLRHQPPSPSKQGTHHPLPFYQRALLSLAVGSVGVAVAASRVYLSYHTPLQVGVGVVAGLLSAAAWFAFTAWLRREGWIEWALDTRLAELGRWRDLVVEEDLVEGGWLRWAERRRARRREYMNGSSPEGQKKTR